MLAKGSLFFPLPQEDEFSLETRSGKRRICLFLGGKAAGKTEKEESFKGKERGGRAQARILI